MGKLPVPGRPADFVYRGPGPAVLAVGAGGGCLDIFFFSSIALSLCRYRLKYCLKGPLSPNNQPISLVETILMLFLMSQEYFSGINAQTRKKPESS